MESTESSDPAPAKHCSAPGGSGSATLSGNGATMLVQHSNLFSAVQSLPFLSLNHVTIFIIYKDGQLSNIACNKLCGFNLDSSMMLVYTYRVQPFVSIRPRQNS